MEEIMADITTIEGIWMCLMAIWEFVVDIAPILITLLIAYVPYHRWATDKKHARDILNKAILAEVRRLLDVVRGHTEWWGDCVSAGTTNHPFLPFSTDVYDEHVKDIGLIDAKVVEEVVRFYGYVKYINRYQGTEAFYREAKCKSYFDETYLLLLNRTLMKFDKAAFER